MQFHTMFKTIENGRGFIAALDQSGGSTPGALKAYGLDERAWSSEAQMFDLIHAFRCRIITSPAFTGDRVLGAILFESTMDAQALGKSVPQALIERGVVPFVKIDKGLAGEHDGVQLMKPMPEMAALLKRAKSLGVFGTKARSVINLANAQGIAALVAQQFEVAEHVMAAGLVAIIEPEINIKSPERAAADQLLLECLRRHLDALPVGMRVILKLSLPFEPGHFDTLADHPRVLRVIALSGGYTRRQACVALSKNRGIIASFSRALLEDLRAAMTDAQFEAALNAAIEEIYTASTSKAA